MKLSLNWLSDFVGFSETDPDKIADAITTSVAEVEKVETRGAFLENCCVGEVVFISRHPNADKLMLCDVRTNEGKKRVVCGGKNIYKGMLVAFAHIGAVVKWHGGETMQLKRVKIRGEMSEGMICAAEELELENVFPDSTGDKVIDLKCSRELIGKPLGAVVGMDDIIFHVDNHSITHRADLFSHIGFARECVAIGLGKWKPPFSSPKVREGGFLTQQKAFCFPKTEIPFKCINEAKNLVPRYLACMLKISDIGDTPGWMKNRLEAVGFRSLNLPIDITNYVAMEVGMPLHSFDSDDFSGDIRVRRAREGEKITTLDKEERLLPDGAVVLSDDSGVFDLLGIMGGLRSSTKGRTRNIYLHSAIVNPISIRNTIMATGHRTEAATVYEKGIPHIMAEHGFFRALELFVSLVPGLEITSRLESHGKNGRTKTITLPIRRLNSFLGKSVPFSRVRKHLEDMDFLVKKNATSIKVIPPLHRIGDIRIGEDIIEEVARIEGFSAFHEEMPVGTIAPPIRCNRVNVVRCSLKERGFMEIVRFSLLGKGIMGKARVRMDEVEEVENPIGEDMKYMRPSLLPGMLEFVSQNIKFTGDVLRVFEVGKVFCCGDESQKLLFTVSSKRSNCLKCEPLLQICGVLREVLSSLNIDCHFDICGEKARYVHPARQANIVVDGKLPIGIVYECHPMVLGNFGIPWKVAVCEMEIGMLAGLSLTSKTYEAIPDYPHISYDVTVAVPGSVRCADLIGMVKGKYEILKDIQLIDLYKDGGRRHLTFRCTYGLDNRTLNEDETRPVHDMVEKTLNGD